MNLMKQLEKSFKKLKNIKEWAHYALDTTIIVIFLHLMEIHLFHTVNFMPNMNFLYLLLVLAIGDRIVHGVLNYD